MVVGHEDALRAVSTSAILDDRRISRRCETLSRGLASLLVVGRPHEKDRSALDIIGAVNIGGQRHPIPHGDLIRLQRWRR